VKIRAELFLGEQVSKVLELCATAGCQRPAKANEAKGGVGERPRCLTFARRSDGDIKGNFRMILRRRSGGNRVRREDKGEVLSAVPSLMHGFPALWCVAGGWAIDLFLGRVTRPHADVELAIFRQDQGLLHRQFPGWEFRKAVAGELAPWRVDERLSLPVHEIHARADKGAALSIEFLLNERVGDDWAFRRDLSVRLPIERAILRGDGGGSDPQSRGCSFV
jgi:Aminoglycoside-2''-adenylyltransferase